MMSGRLLMDEAMFSMPFCWQTVNGDDDGDSDSNGDVELNGDGGKGL